MSRPPSRSRILAALLLLATALAGCAEEPEDETMVPDDGLEPGLPQLHGWVFNDKLEPMADVAIDALGHNGTAVSDADGYYGIEGLPYGEVIVVVAKAEGFESASKSINVDPDTRIRLNFTLVPIPVKEPFHEVLPVFNGIITCQYALVTSQETEESTDCGGGTNENVWEFVAKPELAGVVVEVGWDANTEASATMRATLETLGFGERNIQLARVLGPSVIELRVAEEVASKYYLSGGKMRLTVEVLPETDANEAGAGAGAAVNQDFQAIASMFYIEPPPFGYTTQVS